MNANYIPKQILIELNNKFPTTQLKLIDSPEHLYEYLLSYDGIKLYYTRNGELRSGLMTIDLADPNIIQNIENDIKETIKLFSLKGIT